MVHSITNNVTINDCANIILAAGGTAIMAQDEREVEEITSHADALALNMGALRAQEAMLLAARASKRLGHPVVLDPVAAGASRLERTKQRFPAGPGETLFFAGRKESGFLFLEADFGGPGEDRQLARNNL